MRQLFVEDVCNVEVLEKLQLEIALELFRAIEQSSETGLSRKLGGLFSSLVMLYSL